MSIAAGCACFVLSLLLLRQWWPDGILFYQGLGLACAVALGQWVWTRRGLVNKCQTPGKDALLTLLLCYAFMFTVPTTVDRAYSVRMLQHLANRPGGMTPADLQSWFVTGFAAEGGVDRRLREQFASGNLTEVSGRWVLTERGRWLVAGFDWIQRAFNCGPGQENNDLNSQ